MSKMLIYGKEPYLIREYKRHIIGQIAIPDFNLLVTTEFGEKEQDFVMQSPFLTDRRVLIIEVDNLRADKVLEKNLNKDYPSTDIYLFPKEIDKRLTLFKAFDPKNETKVFDKLGEKELEGFVISRINDCGCRIRQTSYQILMERINYGLEEVTLFDVVHVLDRLCSIRGEITKELIKAVVPKHEKENAFALIELIAEGKAGELFHQCTLILDNSSSNAIGTLSLLLRSYRIAYKNACGYSLKDLGVNPRTFIPKLTRETSDQCMQMIQNYINLIKSGKLNQKEAIRLCFTRLCAIQK